MSFANCLTSKDNNYTEDNINQSDDDQHRKGKYNTGS